MPTIFEVTDHGSDTLSVDDLQYKSLSLGNQPVLEFHTDREVWLTPADSKRLRKALKAWERSVA